MSLMIRRAPGNVWLGEYWQGEMEKVESCINCGACAKACQMNVDPVKNPNSMECIRCGECVDACPKKALHMGFTQGKKKEAAKAGD